MTRSISYGRKQFLVLIAIVLFLNSCALQDEENISRAEQEELYLALEAIDEEKDWRMLKTKEDAIHLITESYSEIRDFHKDLAISLMGRRMFLPALEALERALQIAPGDSSLLYTAGLCAANLSKLQSPELRDQYLDIAERYYLQSNEQQPRYPDTLYALSVLYVFELQDIEKGYDFVQQLLELRSDDIKARFVLAHIHVLEERVTEAISEYTALLKSPILTPLQQQRAEKNIEELSNVQ